MWAFVEASVKSVVGGRDRILTNFGYCKQLQTSAKQSGKQCFVQCL
jgi:hypothetical protein